MDTYPISLSCEPVDDTQVDDSSPTGPKYGDVAWNLTLPPYNDRVLVTPVYTYSGANPQDVLPQVLAAVVKQAQDEEERKRQRETDIREQHARDMAERQSG